MRSRIAPLAAAAAWNLGAWDDLKEFITELPPDGVEAPFFQAIIAVKHDMFSEAMVFIEKARKRLSTELSALLGESYDRAYKLAVSMQQLIELEEIISYKTTNSKERRNLILKMWHDRLVGCQRDVYVWQQILSVRTLVVSPSEDIQTWLKFSSLCRKSGKLNLSYKVLINLMGGSPMDSVPSSPISTKASISSIPFFNTEGHHSRVQYSFFKHLWTAGFRDIAREKMATLTESLAATLVMGNKDASVQRLASRTHLRLAQWSLEIHSDLTDEKHMENVLQHFKQASELDPKCYKAIHWWARTNYELVDVYFVPSAGEQRPSASSPKASMDQRSSNAGHSSDVQRALQFVIPATQGFFRSIELGGQMQLQDTLRLLSLCFKFGNYPKIENVFQQGFETASIDTWLSVIPQLIARINTKQQAVRRLVCDLLQRVGQAHPQSLIYPLTVASKSTSSSRKSAAVNLLKVMKRHSDALVEQALMVSFELIRTAILWQEMWYEALEQASNSYFGTKNIEGMFEALDPLHEMMDKGPETLHEMAFLQSYGKELQEAREWMQRYRITRQESCVNEAWKLYIPVYRKIDGNFRKVKEIQLQHTSPRLLQAKNLDLAVPGTYTASQEVIKISFFHSSLKVLSSKQRPRKLTLRASNGKDYPFLLKGHEDLRQDERVMQLFSLVNTLLANDRETSKAALDIRGYAVVPLAPSSGVLEWLSQCDTLHDLIQEYRSRKKIVADLERLIMLSLAPDKQLTLLTTLQLVDVLEHAQSFTKGQDLYAMLWLKSLSSEVWLDRRTNYIRSLAVMSMVGYILGLGDRHPCNLMLDRITGKIIHIDFGDCFEVAMLRDKFPEKIPFRLTRMLINAMEVSGIQGTFRTTCEKVMRVLRENKESVMAVLEAFVHDPLINWRLLNGAEAALVPNEAGPRKSSTDDIVNELRPEELIGDGAADEPASIASSSVNRRNRVQVVAQAENDDEFKLDVETLNEKALQVVSRVRDKLTGKDFEGEELNVEKQVDRLIRQAASSENLAQCWIGWCPFW
eukprot:TRINITY_DN3834_c0_g2_i1.p1 TRINITY_DN3834_c0_g2~~TRINITY_DN3834_c0_g2_i1.p1  ORF type:complete len:1031 (-),score=234.09 TRINITY_DN3834_c0_g2_i1:66-3158(-)